MGLNVAKCVKLRKIRFNSNCSHAPEWMKLKEDEDVGQVEIMKNFKQNYFCRENVFLPIPRKAETFLSWTTAF